MFTMPNHRANRWLLVMPLMCQSNRAFYKIIKFTRKTVYFTIIAVELFELYRIGVVQVDSLKQCQNIFLAKARIDKNYHVLEILKRKATKARFIISFKCFS
jgi:hypothetical protein